MTWGTERNDSRSSVYICEAGKDLAVRNKINRDRLSVSHSQHTERETRGKGHPLFLCEHFVRIGTSPGN